MINPLQGLPVGSALSNISAPLNSSAKKDFGFHQQFAVSFQNNFQSPEKKRIAGQRLLDEYSESPPTRKQKQLQEFTINLKQNKLKKYCNPVEPNTASVIPQDPLIPTNKKNNMFLNKNLKRRLENSANNDINTISFDNNDRK